MLFRSDTDVIGFYAEGDKTAVQIYTIRGGKLMGRENFSLDNSNDESTAALTGAVLDQYYVEGVFIPREIVVPDVEDKGAYEYPRYISRIKWFDFFKQGNYAK